MKMNGILAAALGAVIVVLGSVPPARAEAPSKADKEAVAKLCEKIQGAFDKKDWEALVSVMPPMIVEESGGEAKLREGLREVIENMEASGLTFVSTSLAPEDRIYRGTDQRIVFVKMTMVMKLKDKTVRSDGFQIAMAKLGEERWYAMDGAKVNEEVFRKMFKGMPKDLQLPKTKVTIE